MRIRILRRLRRSHEFQIVPELKDADAVLKGDGRIWSVGNNLLSPRSHSLDVQVLQGFLSAEVVAKDNQTLWSYLVTPSRFPWNGVADDMAGQLVNKLLKDVQEKGQSAQASAVGTLPNATVTLKGAGATFPAPLYQKWFEAFEQSHAGVHIDYDAVGSGKGIQRLSEGSVDFGASEMPLGDEATTGNHPRFVQVPVVIGALVAIYNVKPLKRNLNLTPEILAGIYLGKIKKWNDPQIEMANRGVTLPDADIVVIHRSDASGSTFVWSDYMSKVSPEWKAKVGSDITLHWPVGIGAEHNEGVAAAVQGTANSIGYVEFIYALQHQLEFAAVRNAAGQFIKADIASVSEAAKVAGDRERGFAKSITDAPGKNAYPIVTYSWLLLRERITDENKRDALLGLTRWMLTSGQRSCSALGYVPLPRDVARRGLETVDQSISASLQP
jgi:phosphate ABC transporter phosphate-binding protein